MSEYKGYDISTTSVLPRPGVIEVGYCVREGGGGRVMYHDALPGPFDSMDAAHSAGELAARQWIDQHSG